MLAQFGVWNHQTQHVSKDLVTISKCHDDGEILLCSPNDDADDKAVM